MFRLTLTKDVFLLILYLKASSNLTQSHLFFLQIFGMILAAFSAEGLEKRSFEPQICSSAAARAIYLGYALRRDRYAGSVLCGPGDYGADLSGGLPAHFMKVRSQPGWPHQTLL